MITHSVSFNAGPSTAERVVLAVSLQQCCRPLYGAKSRIKNACTIRFADQHIKPILQFILSSDVPVLGN
jgi:hypothetical protein